jgi:hypothetical protein
MKYISLLLLFIAPLSAETAGQKLDRGIEKTKEAYQSAKEKTKKGVKKVKDKLSGKKKSKSKREIAKDS